MGGLVSGMAIAALGYVAVTEPSVIIDLVDSNILTQGLLPELSRHLQLSAVKAEKEHL